MAILSVQELEETKTLRSPFQLPETGNGKLVPEYLLEKAEKFATEGKGNWVVDSVTGKSHSYSDFEDETRRIGSAFYKKGLRSKDVVIYMSNNLSEIHTFFCGVWRANGIMRALYPEEDEETVFAAVEESRVGWIYCEPEQAKMCLSVAERIYWDVEVIITHGEVEGCTQISEFVNDDGLELPQLDLSPTDPALMLCTSGTTGRSKSAIHSHETTLNMIISIGVIPWSRDSPNLVLSKATHITGAIWPMSLLSIGSTAIVMDRIVTETSLKAIHEFHPKVVWGFPTLLLQIANDPNPQEYDLSSLELAMTAGAPCSPPMIKAIKTLPNLKTVHVLFGLTETLPLTGTMTWNLNVEDYSEDGTVEIPDFTVGKVSPGVLIQIRDPETNNLMGIGEQGEVCAKADTNFVEYFGNPEATRNAFVDGYFRTGDIGYYDSKGFIMIVDRLKEIFKYRGNHISPTELEDVIARHPAVSTVCVVSVPDPEGRGSVPRAFVTLRQEFDKIRPDEIRLFANGQLAEYKQLRGGVFVVESLPQGKTGKVTRTLVQQLKVPEDA